MISDILNSNRIKASLHVEFTSVNGEVVLLERRSGVYFGLDGIGSLVWQGLVKQSSFEEILISIEQQYEVDRQTLSADVARLLETMKAKGLIEVS